MIKYAEFVKESKTKVLSREEFKTKQEREESSYL